MSACKPTLLNWTCKISAWSSYRDIPALDEGAEHEDEDKGLHKGIHHQQVVQHARVEQESLKPLHACKHCKFGASQAHGNISNMRTSRLDHKTLVCCYDVNHILLQFTQ